MLRMARRRRNDETWRPNPFRCQAHSIGGELIVFSDRRSGSSANCALDRPRSRLR